MTDGSAVLSSRMPAGQSRYVSLIEAIINVVLGFFISLLTQIAIFRAFELQVSMADNLLIGGIFTVVSILRSFTLRRLFEAIRVRKKHNANTRVVLRDHS